MSLHRFAFAAGFALLLVVPAAAQTVGQGPGQRQESLVRVQNNFSFFVAGPGGDSDEAKKARDNARRAIYGIAAKECDLLREVLAKDCKLESISSNISNNDRQYGQPQPEGYTVNGSMNLQIILK
jgi:hypothetical protein